jgi:Flp pilus assembly protein TadG
MKPHPTRCHRGATKPGATRPGATLVEFAVVAAITILLVIGLIVGGMGVYRYQEMAHLAREAARYASTHGGQYYLDGQATRTGVPAVVSSSDLNDFLQSRMTALDATKLTVTVSFSSPETISPRNLPTYMDTDPNLVPPGQKTVQNYVTVTLTYQWQPEFWFSTINLSSTSTMPMSY